MPTSGLRPTLHHSSQHIRSGVYARRAWAGLIGFTALAATLGLTQQAPSSPNAVSSSVNQPRAGASLSEAAIRMPDANAQMEMQQNSKQSKQAKLEAANSARRKQIADDASRLLQLATELKSAVDKTDKDTLSLDVIRKAESIERIAKGVKEKMKLSVGAS